jgi:hypothetical protein
MVETPATPEGLIVFETRVYYHPETGEIVDIHQFVGSPGDAPSSAVVAEEMSAGEERVQKRAEESRYLVVSSEDVKEMEHGIRVDPVRRLLQSAEDSDRE